MLKALKNPTWLGAIFGALAVVVSLVIYLDARPEKQLKIEILSNSPLVSMNTAMSRDMQVLYKGMPVHSLTLILLRIANSGNVPIREDDYSEPLRIRLAPSASIGEVTLQETRPEGIRLTPTVTATGQVDLAPALLNPGDQVVLKILAVNNDSTLLIGARIVGVPQIEIMSILDPAGTSSERRLQVSLWIFLAIVLIIILSVTLLWHSNSVMLWRQKRFGFDPPRYFYGLAQEGMLTLHSVKGDKAASALAQVIRNLDKCFTWDRAYVAKATDDPVFATLLSYERFKDMCRKHVTSS